MEAIQARLNLGLSVILITKNEERHLQACLESVRFADEIIVVDSGSTDRTVEIAQGFGAKVSQTSDWPGFGPQKNRALALATQPWVLSIDADERVTPELQAEIVQVIGAGQYQAFDIPRLSSFCGKPIRHSGWWPDYVLRLFKREAGRFTDVAVHERVETQAPVAKLKFWLLHDPYENLDALITKINRYSGEAAAAMAAAAPACGAVVICSPPPAPAAAGLCVWGLDAQPRQVCRNQQRVCRQPTRFRGGSYASTECSARQHH
jgi:glycosyltransferase involved in cell wall biosynthesis